jgi:hypothetical protein
MAELYEVSRLSSRQISLLTGLPERTVRDRLRRPGRRGRSGLGPQLGPVHLFNPQHIGGVPSTFRWNPFGSAKASGYLRGGRPVFPCHPGEKTPATRHGYRDATTDPERITAWFTRRPDYNLAIATGTPGPDVLDVDNYGPARNGYGALAQLRAADLLQNTAAYLSTPAAAWTVTPIA